MGKINWCQCRILFRQACGQPKIWSLGNDAMPPIKRNVLHLLGPLYKLLSRFLPCTDFSSIPGLKAALQCSGTERKKGRKRDNWRETRCIRKEKVSSIKYSKKKNEKGALKRKRFFEEVLMVVLIFPLFCACLCSVFYFVLICTSTQPHCNTN